MIAFAIGFLLSSNTSESFAQLNVGINWLEICNMSVIDALVSQPCASLTSPDGYTLNSVGINVLGCLSAPALSLVVGAEIFNQLSDLAGCNQPYTGDTLNPGQQNLGPKSTGLSESLIFDNPNLGFKLEYPSDWTKEESLSFISPRLSISDEAPESIAVTTEPNLSNLTLEEYSDSSLSILESQFSNYTLIESSNSTLSGYPAHQIIYTYTLEGVDLKNLQIWAIADDMVYVLTYGGTTKEFDDSLPVIQSMIDTFQVKEVQ